MEASVTGEKEIISKHRVIRIKVVGTNNKMVTVAAEAVVVAKTAVVVAAVVVVATAAAVVATKGALTRASVLKVINRIETLKTTKMQDLRNPKVNMVEVKAKAETETRAEGEKKRIYRVNLKVPQLKFKTNQSHKLRSSRKKRTQ